MVVYSYGITNIGNVRENNEDNFFICGCFNSDTGADVFEVSDTAERERYVYGVFDGMGGEEYGELASLECVKALKEQWKENDFTFGGYIKETNKRICRKIDGNGGYSMGSTAVILSIENDVAQICNVGDSRAYLIRKNECEQLSYDHTVTQRMITNGILTKEEALTHKSRHKLTQYLGIYEEEMIIEPFLSDEIKLMSGDKFLLCSDGISDVLSDDDISNCLSEEYEIKSIVKKTVDLAMEKGSADNLTALVVAVK